MPISIPLCIHGTLLEQPQRQICIYCVLLFVIFIPQVNVKRCTYDHGKLEKIRGSKKDERCSYYCSGCIRLGLYLLVTPMYAAIRLESNDWNRFEHNGSIDL
jgi:hypothetical protein